MVNEMMEAATGKNVSIPIVFLHDPCGGELRFELLFVNVLFSLNKEMEIVPSLLLLLIQALKKISHCCKPRNYLYHTKV